MKPVRRPLPLPMGFLLVLLAAFVPVLAATQKVDDSASEVLGSNVRMRWDSLVPRPGEQASVSGAMTVIVRLNVAPWKGRQARIHMTLPVQPSGRITTTWTSRGPLLAGVLRDGERTLVYAGLIGSDVIEDTLQLTLQADGRKLSRPEQLNYSFEIDLDAP